MPAPFERRTIQRILKVNHAGEYGAIRIYRAQLAVARILYPEISGFLQHTLAHENRHCTVFRDAMPARNARPCRIMALWGTGGYVLGLLTALGGRQGIWVCTAAVESTVHRHLEDQLRFLAGKDNALHAAIVGIRSEELSHLHHAEARLKPADLWAHLLFGAICKATETAIWLSTWGDSTRMARELREP